MEVGDSSFGAGQLPLLQFFFSQAMCHVAPSQTNVAVSIGGPKCTYLNVAFLIFFMGGALPSNQY